MAILLRESDVAKLATMTMAIEGVEQAFRFQGEQKADNAPGAAADLTTACCT